MLLEEIVDLGARMQVQQLRWCQAQGWDGRGRLLDTADLVFYFGTRAGLADGDRYRELRRFFPSGQIVGCTTGGHIQGDEIKDEEVVAVAVRFDRTTISVAKQAIPASTSSRSCGASLAQQLAAPDLAAVFVLSDGLAVNGSELVAGFVEVLGPNIPITGGLAGDGAEFEATLVGADCEPVSGLVGAIGLYGRSIRVGHGSAGGWDVFGPRRRVSRSKGNVLFELDGKPALDLYIRYLGEKEAAGLPGTALLFPLQISELGRPDQQVVRTVLAVDHDARTMTFAGDVPEGWIAQLMRGQIDRLAAGAADAALQAHPAILDEIVGDRLAILVSCIGRRLLMGQRVWDEVAAVGAELGGNVTRIGFYSYGEIAPHATSGRCELHNQTMTITTLAEVGS